MKKLFIALSLAAAAFSAGASQPNDTIVSFTVEPPMSCANCENKIKSNLRFEKGVKGVEASAKKAIVQVKFDKTKTSVGKLIPAFKKIGYQAKPVVSKGK